MTMGDFQSSLDVCNAVFDHDIRVISKQIDVTNAPSSYQPAGW